MISNIPSQIAPELIIPAKVNQIYAQTNELNENIAKDILNITERIKSIGLKFNSINHPFNITNNRDGCEVNASSSLKEQVKPALVDGLEGALNNVIDNGQSFINRWHNTYYRDLMVYIEYIEKHI